MAQRNLMQWNFSPGLAILAGRSGMGKTSLGIQIAVDCASRGRHVLFVSFEQSATGLASRILCQWGGVNNNHIRTGTLGSDEKQALVEASDQLAGAHLEIVSPAGVDLDHIRRLAFEQKRKNDLQLLVIDYLQLIEPENPTAPRQEQLATMTRQLKGLARELNIAVLCLAQLNRGVDRPELANLRESGMIEQDADVVLLIHRPEVYSNDADDHGQAVLICAKNRNGPTRDYHLTWDALTTTFTPARLPDDWEPEEGKSEETKQDVQQHLEF